MTEALNTYSGIQRFGVLACAFQHRICSSGGIHVNPGSFEYSPCRTLSKGRFWVSLAVHGAGVYLSNAKLV